MKKSIIKQAKTKEEAINLALAEIGKVRSEVEIEILDQGSAGFLGIGSKDAVVRITYDEDISNSLFDIESEIKRDSLGRDYDTSERSKYFTDEAAVNYEREENPNEVKNYQKDIERAGEAFDRSVDYIRDNPEDNLGEYGRFEKINEYEQNAKNSSRRDEDLSIEFERRMDAIDDDGYEVRRREYVDPNPVKEEVSSETTEISEPSEFSEETRVIEEANPYDAIIIEDDNRKDQVSETVIERTELKPDSVVTFTSAPTSDKPISSDFTGTSNKPSIAQQKQQTDIDKYYQAKEFLEEILAAMHFENASVIGNLEANTISLDAKVDENDTGIAIGKGGITLDAIELIIRKSIDSRANNLRVNVDINNYKKRRDEKIRELAADTARKVQRSKKSWNLKYMNSYERRLAHEEIGKFPNVESHSEGQEPKRYVVVSYVGDEEE